MDAKKRREHFLIMQIFIRIQRQEIALFTKIFEAMSHLAVVTTIDRAKGVLRVCCSDDQDEDVRLVIEALRMANWEITELCKSSILFAPE